MASQGGPHEEVLEHLRPEDARVPNFDPTLGVPVARDEDARRPAHRLVTVGDSLTHGFQSGAIHNTDLSYPALIARELGNYDSFQHPSYDRFGGLPMNIEYFLRVLEARFGDRISPWEVPLAALKIVDLMDEIEDWWERDAQDPQRFSTRNNNLGIYGWDLFDATTRSALDCRQDIVKPTDALLKQVVQNANERAALRVLAPGPPEEQERLSPIETAVALGAEGTREKPGEGDGIETLIVMLGANNCLMAVTELRVQWSQKSSYEDEIAKRRYTVWNPEHFRQELAELVKVVRDVKARHVILATVPHVTIAPVARGIGDKLTDGSRYFPFYARPWVSDERFDPHRHPHLTADQARMIDAAIDRYNQAIEDAVRAARGAGRDWYLLDVCGHLDRLAARRYIDDVAAQRPQWWTPYPLPQALRGLSPVPDSHFLRCDPQHGRTAGGLFSLDGVHPTTIMYGLMAQEFIRVMELAGVRFEGSTRPGPVQIDFGELIRRDSLISDPPRSLSSDLGLIAWLDDKYGIFKRMLSKGA
ncbi:MAG: hypothetical protein QOI73_2419 [Solirubrobacteraceae bacterium]|nr:hypothetical protein [Solirubrobacteraceae bacterium]